MIRPCAVVDCNNPVALGSPYCEKHIAPKDLAKNKFKRIAKLNREVFKLIHELSEEEYKEFLESPYIWP